MNRRKHSPQSHREITESQRKVKVAYLYLSLALGCVQISATRRAASCGDWNWRQATWTILLSWIFLSDFVDDFHDDKNHERDDYEVDNIVEERAVSDDGNTFRLGIGE